MATSKSNVPIQALVLTDRSDSVNRLQHLFSTEKKYTVQFTNSCQEAMQITAHEPPDVILVDESIRGAAPLEAIRKLALVAPAVPIVAVADEKAVAYVREAMLAGARAFMLKPLNEAEVFTTLNQVVELETLRHDSVRSKQTNAAQRNQMIALISPKGGAGCTTLAVNLAVLLRRHADAQVALVDGHSSLGDLETVLNLKAQFTCSDVLGQGPAMDLDLIQGMMAEHKSGLRVLVSNRNVEDSYNTDADSFEKMLSLLIGEYDYVVIDGGSIVEEQTSVVLDAADRVLLVATPEMTSLHRTSLFLKAADENNFPREKIFLVVNREGVKGGIPTDDISRHLNMQVFAAIPEDVGLVTYSQNRGIPLVIGDPRSAVARRIDKLARQLIPVQKKTSQPEKGVLGKLTTMFQGGTA